jgi:hypothetical protein
LFAEVFKVISTWRARRATKEVEGAMADILAVLNRTISVRSLIRSRALEKGLLDLLDDTRDLQASDPRDQVYSILGILSKQKRRAYGIKPSYSDTNRIADVMATVAKAAVQTDHQWPFEYLSGHEAKKGFPTWVPDFHDDKPSQEYDSAFFQAGKNLWVNPSFLDNGRRMRVSAIKLGIVEVIRKRPEWTMHMPQPEDVLQEWYRLAMKRARDHEEPCSLRLLKEFLEVVYHLGCGELPFQLPEDCEQHDWQSPTNLDQRALDRIFTQARRIESEAGESFVTNIMSAFFILQDGTHGLHPLWIAVIRRSWRHCLRIA